VFGKSVRLNRHQVLIVAAHELIAGRDKKFHCADTNDLASLYSQTSLYCEAHAVPRSFSLCPNGEVGCGLAPFIEILDETAGNQFTNEFRFHEPLRRDIRRYWAGRSYLL
jgi:hypothetical protein